ncbi:hypothetical protein AW736_00835 [Termitidicoccus mucosus]|uniref:Gylcosyl hydrolase 115 C-terminal domain-containing protein n=1 Tax=Termitidicoccus mucosus TaxID=1184151 RepID=A0A178IKB8_9BACT|nr:hypothetical protein AW736_00835 [Opitutaceae bacterium TSB47]
MFLLVAASLFGAQSVRAQVTLTSALDEPNVFALRHDSVKTVIVYDSKDAEVVKKSARLFADDIQRVTDKTVSVGTKPVENCVVVGTLGQNALIDRWASEGKLSDTDALRGAWECYTIQLLRDPQPGIKTALVVAGSDRRGAAYGLLSISELIGVSPWYWWADVPAAKKTEIILQVNKTTSKPPTVKYRGIFINDEDWGLANWAKNTFEPGVKIGPKTYEKVCELLLRLKANYLCPAMHGSSHPFNKFPENAEIANSYAIVMGSTHCEPLLFNNATEWDKKTMGDWNYATNSDTINSVLRKRVKDNGKYENVYTLALRGLHDAAMQGSANMDDRVRLMESALIDQRQILTDVLKKTLTDVPQAFFPYKEVLDVYSRGLKVPDDVTIVWADDNYGYMKRLSNPAEQKRPGRSGVYYHVSYLGKPHDYLWMGSTSPALMYEELRKAYDTTADRIWLLNVGDIKSCEFHLQLFIDMAWNINAFNYDNIANHHARWLAKNFNAESYRDYLNITSTFYRLAFSRKPELMGWGYEWNVDQSRHERVTDTEYSFSNYKEAEKRLADYDRIGKAADRLMNALPKEQQPAFFQLVYYPVRGAELMNRVHLNAQKNRIYARQGRAATNEIRDEVRKYYEELKTLTAIYNNQLGGKWNGMMSLRMGGPTTYHELPPTETVELLAEPAFGIQAEGEDVQLGTRSYNALPCFNPYLTRAYYVDVYNKSAQPLAWTLTTSAPWIVVSRNAGATATEDRIMVAIDWSKVPAGEENLLGTIEIAANNIKRQVLVSAFNPATPARAEIGGLYVEDNGCVSIPANGYARKTENGRIKMRAIHNLGYEDKCVQLGNPIQSMERPSNLKSPSLEYDFYTFHAGPVDVYTYALPTFPIFEDPNFAGHETTNVHTRFGICIDDGAILTPTSSSFEYAKDWYESVLRNCAIRKTTLYISKPGKHTLRVICGTPGIVLQKFVIDLGGMKRSYMGPPSTRVPANE